MRQLKRYEKLIFFINSLMAFALLLSYILPYMPPQRFAFLSVLSLAVPFLILINILFFIYWLLKVKKQLLLSFFVLIIGLNYVFSLYKFSSSKNIDHADNISVMNYNVRLFNLFDWIDDPNTKANISNFISEKNPDILCMQEYKRDDEIELKGYHKVEKLTGHKFKSGQAIFTKFPIINSGSIEFPNTSNNAIFADVIIHSDTVRIYNLHFESLRIDSNVENLAKEKSENLIKRISTTFKMQQSQVEQFLEHKAKCPYKSVLLGDFNNTAYSYIYKEIKGDNLKDAFVQAGNGFGRTFNFKFFPVRIDFVLVDDTEFDINGFKTFDVTYSDHYPIMAKLKLK
ncbi:MAG: endonuclease/exonuclease/phosphatase family protein [Algicola sp.]|nr:endonuclease/exonuclease/phosphatase family protein [Algicola sp.]